MAGRARADLLHADGCIVVIVKLLRQVICVFSGIEGHHAQSKAE